MRALMAAAFAVVVGLPGVASAQAAPDPNAQPAQGGVQANVVINAPGGAAPVAAPAPVPAQMTPGVAIQPLMDGRPAPITVTGPVQAACPLTPCQMPLVPGAYTLNVQGPGGFTRGFNLPGVPSVIGYRQRHTGRLVGGIVELAIGGPLALSGLLLTGIGALYWSSTVTAVATLGVVYVVVGVIALAVGIPLTIVGALNIAHSGPVVDVRPGAMTGARSRPRNRALLTPRMGLTGDGYTGNVLQTIGVAF